MLMSTDPKSSYYDVGGLETIDIIKAKIEGLTDPFDAYCLGNILKYACRAPYKGTMDRDIEKIRIYSKMMISYSDESKEKTKKHWNKMLTGLNKSLE